MTNPKLRFKKGDGSNFSDWTKCKLKDFCKINPKSKNLPKEFIYIDLESVSKGRLIKETKISKLNAPSRAQRLLKANDVLFQTVRPYQQNNLIYVDNKIPAVASTGYAQLRCTKNSPYFLYTTVHGAKFLNEVITRCTGGAYPAINPKSLGEIEISEPDLEEQQKIASFFSTLDEKIQCTENALNLTSKIFTYFLNRYIVDATKNNSCLFEEIASISSASRVHKKEWLNDGVPFFRSSDVVSKFKNQENPLGKAYISPELYKKLTKKSGELKKGDILVTGGGSVGIPYLIESDDPIYTKDADLLWIKPKPECVNSKFLYYYIVSKAFRSELNKISHQGTISHLTISQLKQFLIPTPAISEQKRIVNNLDLFSLKLNILRKKLVLLESLKKGFMQQMFV